MKNCSSPLSMSRVTDSAVVLKPADRSDSKAPLALSTV